MLSVASIIRRRVVCPRMQCRLSLLALLLVAALSNTRLTGSQLTGSALSHLIQSLDNQVLMSLLFQSDYAMVFLSRM